MINTQQNSNAHVISPIPNTDTNRLSQLNANKNIIYEDSDIKLPWWQNFCISVVCMLCCCPCYSVYLCALCCCKEKLEKAKISDINEKRRKSSIIKAFPFLNMGTNPTIITNTQNLHNNVYSNAPPQINFNQEHQQNNHYRTGTADVLHDQVHIINTPYVNQEKKNQQKVLTIVEHENTKTQNDDLLIINHKESYKSKRSKSKAMSRQKSLKDDNKDDNNQMNRESYENQEI